MVAISTQPVTIQVELTTVLANQVCLEMDETVVKVKTSGKYNTSLETKANLNEREYNFATNIDVFALLFPDYGLTKLFSDKLR